MQKYPTQGGMQTPKIYLWIYTKKEPEIKHFSSPNAKFS